MSPAREVRHASRRSSSLRSSAQRRGSRGAYDWQPLVRFDGENAALRRRTVVQCVRGDTTSPTAVCASHQASFCFHARARQVGLQRAVGPARTGCVGRPSPHHGPVPRVAGLRHLGVCDEKWRESTWSSRLVGGWLVPPCCSCFLASSRSGLFWKWPFSPATWGAAAVDAGEHRLPMFPGSRRSMPGSLAQKRPSKMTMRARGARLQTPDR